VNKELVLWAFKRACLEQPTESTMYYDALIKISKRPERNAMIGNVNELGNEGNWQGNWTDE
jgi:hypothetical protein